MSVGFGGALLHSWRVGHGTVMGAPGWGTKHSLLFRIQLSPATGQLHRHSDWVLSTFLLFSEAGERVLQGRVETHRSDLKQVGLRPAHGTPILSSTLNFN